jgi:hypothetical protein
LFGAIIFVSFFFDSDVHQVSLVPIDLQNWIIVLALVNLRIFLPELDPIPGFFQAFRFFSVRTFWITSSSAALVTVAEVKPVEK